MGLSRQDVQQFVGGLSLVQFVALPAIDHRPDASGAVLKALGQHLLSAAQQNLRVGHEARGARGQAAIADHSSARPVCLAELTRNTAISRQPGKLNSSRTCDSSRSAPGQIGLVDHDDVGDFQQAGFFPLQFVARSRAAPTARPRRPARGPPYRPGRPRPSPTMITSKPNWASTRIIRSTCSATA